MEDNRFEVEVAQSRHFEAVLAMSEGVYDGQDYLPFCYQAWIQEEGTFPEQRRNFILVKQPCGQIVGFRSFLFQYDTVLDQGVRIYHKMRGQGLSKLMLTLCAEQLGRELDHRKFVKAICHRLCPSSPQPQTVVSKRLQRFLALDLGQVDLNRLESTSHPNLVGPSDLGELIFNNPELKALVMDGDYVTVMWVPFLIKNQSDIRKMKPYTSDLRARWHGQGNSMSILTLPFPGVNCMNVGLDLFAREESDLVDHLVDQVQFAVDQVRRGHSGLAKIVLWLSCELKFHQIAVKTCLDRLQMYIDDDFGTCEAQPAWFVLEQKGSRP